MNKRVSFHTFGCRLNQAETASIEHSFKSKGYQVVDDSKLSDIVVINTCTVTKNGDADTRKLVNRLVRKNPEAQIALIGCQAQVQGHLLSKMPNIRWIVGNARKLELASIIGGDTSVVSYPFILTESIPQNNFKIRFKGTDRRQTRANLKIQDGCDFYCFFCVIPYARGRARSREFGDLEREAKDLVAAGHKEIVLTGVNVGTYSDEHHRFMDVVHALERIKGLRRLRISSIEPTTIPYELLDKMKADSVVCRYLHIPLQSGSDKILFKMNRRYSTKDYTDFIEQAVTKVQGICLGTDVIVGYPGESDALFDETLDFVKATKFTYIHVFSYSERGPAKSKKFSHQIPEDRIRSRSRVLRQLSDEQRNTFMTRHIGTEHLVLFEQRKNGFWTGLTDNFIRVKVASDLNLHNELIPVRLVKIDCRDMIGLLA